MMLSAGVTENEGRISSVKAARLLNISRVEFLNLLRARGIAYVNFTPDELAEELAAVECFPRQNRLDC
jgi:predicted HTH domain antitoxin